jgi:hypothetical protein
MFGGTMALLLPQILPDSVALVKEFGEQIARSFVNETTRPWFFMASMLGNALFYLPVIMLPIPAWREVIIRFVTDDDKQFNKSDLRDGGINIIAFYLFTWCIHIATYDLMYQENHIEHIWTLGGFGLTLWGVKEITKPKQSHERSERSETEGGSDR